MKQYSHPSEEETRAESLDTLFQGKLSVIQKRKGYRFSLDAVLLAHFVIIGEREKIMDLGTGSGIISLILSYLHPSVNIVGLEIQQEMVRRALESVRLNRLTGKVDILQGDVRSIEQAFPAKSFDTVVCNPPFRRLASGRMNPDPERRIARHEIEGELKDFLRAGVHLLRDRGKMALIYPAAHALDLLETMRQAGLEPKRLRFVHSFKGSEATLVLAEGVKGAGRECEVLPPLLIYSRTKEYTPEVKAILRE